jgi:RND family efflux transporter MFP subunit
MDSLGITHSRLRHSFLSLLAVSCLCVFAGVRAWAAATTADGFVTVRAGTMPHVVRGYGQVEPMSVIRVRAVEPGTLRHFRVLPGSTVAAGEELARISGPQMRSTLTAREASRRSAQAREESANRALAIVRRQLAAQLATRQAEDAAQAELAAAQAAVQTADVQLQEARSQQTLRAPTAGTVIAVQAADGEQIKAGETILTLQPAGRLWIRAAYYGTDAALLRVGMAGRFQPAGDSDAIPIKVATVASSLAPDGGRNVGLTAASGTSAASWVSGQWGTVTLEGASRTMVAVPTSALILDHGTWWVLVHTSQGNHPQKVVPGPTQGWQTWIASGLQPGQQVVTQDAFLEFHRGIAQSYQPPD